jgi:hypothetical protein
MSVNEEADRLRLLIVGSACGPFVAVLRNLAEIVLAHANRQYSKSAAVLPSRLFQGQNRGEAGGSGRSAAGQRGLHAGRARGGEGGALSGCPAFGSQARCSALGDLRTPPASHCTRCLPATHDSMLDGFEPFPLLRRLGE